MNFTRGLDNGYSKKNMQPLMLNLQKKSSKSMAKNVLPKEKNHNWFALASQKYTIGLK
jgi:hypothetical protein